MLEIPECATLSRQLTDTLAGKTIRAVSAAQSPHGFAFYLGDPQTYHGQLCGKSVAGADAVAGYVVLRAGDRNLAFHDGVGLRWLAAGEKRPQKHQLLIEFEDGSCLVCTVRMYGGMYVFAPGDEVSVYYRQAVDKPSPLSDAFDAAYFEVLLRASSLDKLSAKAFLATEQRIPGLGNGVLQDILFRAGVHPKRRMNTLSDAQTEALFWSVRRTLVDMSDKGGRDTEKDLFGRPGGYATALSKNTAAGPCPVCGGAITKQAYLGGSVYFCGRCQPL